MSENISTIINMRMPDTLSDESKSVNMFLVTTDAASCRPDCCVYAAPLADDEADELAHQLRALADQTRIKVISMLATATDGELCACDLPAALGKSQPTTSHHLKLLTEAGLLEREQRGKWAWFRLRDDRLAALRTALGDHHALA